MSELKRRACRTVTAGGLPIGGNSHIVIQSMTNTETADREATYRQVKQLADAGCEMVRLAVPDIESASTFAYLKEKGITVPLVADIHFDYRIALASIEAGVDKIRINPGNIGSREKIEAVVRAANDKKIPIRIGVNSGSLEKHILEKYGSPTAEAIAESALYHVGLLEDMAFRDIVISVNASDVSRMISANMILAERTSYPLHLGVTEAGGLTSGMIKSAVGIGSLLSRGIGDTIRVSLTADPIHEIAAAREILSSLDLLPEKQMDIVSCPTCGRTRIDLIPLLAEFESKLDERGLRHLPIKVAFMGCAVNGPGEARDADIGIAGGDGEALLFRRGEIVGKYPQGRIVDILLDAIEKDYKTR